MQLRHRIVGVQDGHLLVNFANDEAGQCHARDRTYEFHRGPVMDVPVPNGEFFALTLIFVNFTEKKKNKTKIRIRDAKNFVRTKQKRFFKIVLSPFDESFFLKNDEFQDTKYGIQNCSYVSGW